MTRTSWKKKIKCKICGGCPHKYFDDECSLDCKVFQIIWDIIAYAKTWGGDEIEQLRGKLELANKTNRRILANYQPIKHGHWMFRYGSLATCSVCGGHCGRYDDDTADNYCSRCGAKMDEDVPGYKDEENRLLTMDEVRAQRLVWAENKEYPTSRTSLLLLCWLKRYADYDYFVVIGEEGIYRENLVKMRVYTNHHSGCRFWWKEPTVEERKLEWRDGNE